MNTPASTAKIPDTAPAWVRQAQADRYLCRCGQPGITVWAGTGEILCDTCLNKRQGR